MPLKQRIVRITIKPKGGQPVVLESIGGENFSARVNIAKAIDTYQQQCTIDIVGLTASVRGFLLSNFSAYQNQLVQDGVPLNYCDVQIEAGYRTAAASSNGVEQTDWTSVLFVGQIVTAQLVEGPPDPRVVIQCATRQNDKTTWTQPLPNKSTYRNICELIANQMGLNLVGATSFDAQEVSNFGTSKGTLSSLVTEIQNMTLGRTVAWADGGNLYVSDANKAIDPSQISLISEFVGIPSVDSYGFNGRTLLAQNNPTLGSAVQVMSVTDNKQPGFLLSDRDKSTPLVSGKFVVTILEYEICTREPPFYCRMFGALPA